ncbi:MAG: VacJ family lipoprotein [Alphaproteobacteria bacterium]|nr:VacJ family lipoprotein [Alphaproteobacteria bacterium]
MRLSTPTRRRGRSPLFAVPTLATAVLLLSSGLVKAQTPAVEPQTPEALIAGPPATSDPWERLNRQTYALNASLDRAVFAPITHGYRRAAPTPVQRGLSSLVSNFREPRTVLNGLVQGRPGLAGRSAGRFVVNSTAGLFGLIDVATPLGLEAGQADFGQTLGRYGIGPGPYLIIPVLGPHNVRDAIGRVVDTMTDPVGLALGGLGTTFGISRLVASGLDYRVKADAALVALDDATDPYATMRSAYGQYTAGLVREASGDREELPDFDDPASPN